MKNNTFFEQELQGIPGEEKLLAELSMKIAKGVSDILKKRGMSKTDLAKLLGKKESEISRWLSGTHNFTLKSLALIASRLGESIIGVTCFREPPDRFTSLNSGLIAAEPETVYSDKQAKTRIGGGSCSSGQAFTFPK